MPGITGFIARPENPGDMLDQMVGSMMHEPSYKSGTLRFGELNLGIGWVNHQNSFSDGLPFWNEKRDVCLIFSGEEFTEPAEIEGLKSAGHRLEANANYLVHLYEEKGARFFESLNGTFSGVIVDLREQKITLFNDRYGLGRIYFHENAEGFFFASEAKALLKVFPQLRQMEMQGLGELFTLGCVLQDRTLFKGVSLLPPASVWTFKPQQTVTKQRYFSRETWETQETLSATNYYERLKETFVRILPRYFRSGEKMSMSLTGGLDSRIIMAWDRSAPTKLPCYSHRGVFRECADAKIARRVAEICRQPHRTITVDGEFFSDFSKLANQSIYITDGAMDASGAAGLYVNRIARREIAPVRMTGNYGSEILRRLVAFKPRSFNKSLFDDALFPCLGKAAASYASESRGNALSFVAFKQMPWHHYARFALEQSQLTIRSPYLDNDLVALAYQAPPGLTTNQQFAARLIADGNPALATFPTDRGPLGRNGFFGKAREQYQEFMFKAEYAYDYGMPQWLTKLDNAVSPLHLEKIFLGRHKYCHFRFWYRHELAPYVREILLDRRTLDRPYLNGHYVKQIVDAHVNGKGNYTSEIHMLLSSELIQRQLIEQRS